MQKILLWGGLALTLILLVYLIIPVNIYKSALYLIAIAGPVGIGISLIAFYISVTSYVRRDKEEKENGSEGFIILAVLLISVFGGGFLSIYHETRLEQRELNENGIFAYARIVNGSSFTTRKLDLSSVEVTFKQENGKTGYAEISIPKSLFQQLYLDQEIPIVYSKRYLSINKVLVTPEEMRQYRDKTPLVNR